MTRSLVATKDSSIIQQTYHNNYVEWGPPLSLTQYLHREATLSECAFAKSLTCWTLIDSANQLLSHCETYQRPVMVFHQGRQLHAFTLSIASVFTRVEVRGCGNGRDMMTQLKNRLLTPTSIDDLFHPSNGADRKVIVSNLYSDIGPNYYRALGWTPYCITETSIPISELHKFVPSTDPYFITFSNLPTFLESYTTYHKTTSLRRSESSPTPIVFIPPTLDTITWLRTRSELFATFLSKPLSESDPVGCFLSPTDFIIYFHDFKAGTLFVCLSLFETDCGSESKEKETNAMVLVQKALEEAKRCFLGSLTLWSLPGWIVKGLKKNGVVVNEVVLNKESIPSLATAWDGDTEWVGIEKYAWV